MGKVHSQVAWALKKGTLKRGPCEQEGSDCKGRVLAHHDDYAKPLDVRWLCRRHHGQFHSAGRRGINRSDDPSARICFYDSPEREAKLKALASEERRTQTVLMQEALDLLFASRDNENHSQKVEA